MSKYVGTGSSLSNYSLIVESDRRVTLLDYTDLYLFSNDVINSLYGKETFLTAAQLTQFMTYYSSVLKNSVTSRYFRGEAQLSGAIDYVTAAEVPHGYLLTGHGDAALPELMLNALSSYGLSTLDLSAAGQVPTDADCDSVRAGARPDRDGGAVAPGVPAPGRLPSARDRSCAAVRLPARGWFGGAVRAERPAGYCFGRGYCASCRLLRDLPEAGLQ